MSVVVSDTSPIRALAHLELLPLLGELYDVVVIPPAVFKELTRDGKLFTSLSRADLALFCLREPALEIAQTTEFLELDAGEREAIRAGNRVIGGWLAHRRELWTSRGNGVWPESHRDTGHPGASQTTQLNRKCWLLD